MAMAILLQPGSGSTELTLWSTSICRFPRTTGESTRLIQGLFADPKGWPEGSPLWSSTLSSYKVIPLCHRYLTPKYRQLVADMAASKRVHHLKSPRAMTSFLDAVRHEYASVTTAPSFGILLDLSEIGTKLTNKNVRSLVCYRGQSKALR